MRRHRPLRSAGDFFPVDKCTCSLANCVCRPTLKTGSKWSCSDRQNDVGMAPLIKAEVMRQMPGSCSCWGSGQPVQTGRMLHDENRSIGKGTRQQRCRDRHVGKEAVVTGRAACLMGHDRPRPTGASPRQAASTNMVPHVTSEDRDRGVVSDRVQAP